MRRATTMTAAPRPALESGFGLLLTLLAMGLIVLTLGAGIDFSHLFLVRGELQGLADEAALRAARELDGTAEGAERARRTASDTFQQASGRLSMSTDRILQIRTRFATATSEEWNERPNPADGYRLVEVRVEAEARLFFLPMVPETPATQRVIGRAVAGQQPGADDRLTSPFSITAKEPGAEDFGFELGTSYPLSWTGGEECPRRLEDLARFDTDTVSTAYRDYSRTGNGQRVLVVAVHNPEQKLAGYAAFLIPPLAEASEACAAAYVGDAPVLNTRRNGAGGPGLYEVRLVQ